MGCSVGRSSMSVRGAEAVGEAGEAEDTSKRRLERKLYLARESPEPSFELSGCALRRVPPGVYALCRVLRKEALLLDRNELSSLEGGGALADLHLLRALNLSRNRFSQLHGDIRCLIHLTELDLSDNQLSRLPDAIGDLDRLQTIDVSRNNLKELPISIGRLKALRVLKLKGNTYLTVLPPELCVASNIISIELDSFRFTSPPADVAASGTAGIMMSLCKQMNIPYEPPADVISESVLVERNPSYLVKAFQNDLSITWEDQEKAMIKQEMKIHEAAKLQRKEFMSQIVKEQSELDAEIVKLQGEKERERRKLMREIQADEKSVTEIVSSFLNSNRLNPEILQQQLEYEQMEHDRVLDMCRQNYQNIRKADILKAMETLLQEECVFQSSMKNYESSLCDVKQSIMLQDLESSEKLEQIFELKDQSHSALVEQLLQDQDIQKAVVASLLERVDARSWSLNQEIAIVTSNLAKLSVIEQEKQKLKVNYNYADLLDQRIQLLNLLDDLLDQQNKRRAQLIQTLKEMESEIKDSTDFWLANYQRLVDSAPKSLLDVSKTLDPVFANYLLQEGVIHCLPFLVKLIFTNESLIYITLKQLKESGVNLTSDREGILRAIKKYVDAKTEEKHDYLETNENVEAPSAPPESEASVDDRKEVFTGIIQAGIGEDTIKNSECVICMDASCEIVFIPCAHLCCCSNCADNNVHICPMCRVAIERKVKVIIP